MTTNDLHEIAFFWPHTDVDRVVVTGTFDNWSKSLRLTKGPDGFSVSVKVPWSSTIAYKYIVDGRWTLDESKPKKVEPEGYVNNVYVAPSKPSTPLSSPGIPAKATPGGEAAPLGLTGRTTTQNNQAELAEKVPDKLKPKSNGHAVMDKLQRGVPSEQEAKAKELSTKDTMVSLGGQQMESEIAAAVGQTVVPKAEEPSAGKNQEERPSGPASKSTEQPVEEPSQAMVGELAEVSQVKEAEHVAVSSSPVESNRPVRMSFVPVNVAPEAATNGIFQESKTDETASTHKPLGSISKPPCSPLSEAAPGAAKEAVSSTQDAEPAQPESRIPITSYVPPSEAAPPSGSDMRGEGKGAESRPPAGGTGAAPVAPEQTKASTPPEAVSTTEPSKESPKPMHAAEASQSPTVTEPTKDPEPTAEKSVPAPSKTVATGRAEFPGNSRESGEAQAKSQPNGTPRKKKTTIIQKIKRVFIHEGKGKK